MKPTITMVSVMFILTACIDMGFNDEIDKTTAKKLIEKYENTETVDSVLMEDSNVERFIPNGNYYLLINNSFNGDYSGLVYSKNGIAVPDTMKFDIFYIKSKDSIDNKWTSVTGEW